MKYHTNVGTVTKQLPVASLKIQSMNQIGLFCKLIFWFAILKTFFVSTSKPAIDAIRLATIVSSDNFDNIWPWIASIWGPTIVIPTANAIIVMLRHFAYQNFLWILASQEDSAASHLARLQSLLQLLETIQIFPYLNYVKNAKVDSYHLYVNLIILDFQES